MEIAFLLLIVASAGAGFFLARRISATAAWRALLAGLLTAALGILIIVLVAVGRFPFWLGAVSTVVLLAVGGLLISFGIAAWLNRRT